MTVNKYLTHIEDLSNRVIALTGGTSGIGLALLHHLVNKNAKVILLAHDLNKANKLKEEYKDSIIGIIEYDQSSTSKIKKGVDVLISTYPNIDTVVLNAGVLGDKRYNEEKYNNTIMIDYVGVRTFIDYFSSKFTNKVRFVIQGSIVAGLNLKKPFDLHKEKMGFFAPYNISKIYVEAYFHKLVKENKYPNIEYVLTEPGISSTGIVRNFNSVIRFLGKYFLKIVFHSPKKASLTLLTGVSKQSKSGDFITPRGLFTMSGFPKIKQFPKKREREYLFEKEG